MSVDPAAVTTDDLFDVLARLGCPTVLAHSDLHPPGPDDLPQLTGVLAAAVDRLTIAHRVPHEMTRMRAWAAGYLQTSGAAGGACGSRTAFDTITVRLQMLEVLLEGYRTGGPLAALIRALLGAVSSYAVASATATAVRAGILERDAPDTTALARDQIARGHDLLATAALLENQLRATADGNPGSTRG